MGEFIAFMLGLAVLSGCASPISENLRNQAVPLTLLQAKANPQSTRGAVVIWGGRIISTANTTNGGEIYVLELPLGRRENPNSDDNTSTGRFIALSPEFLDPAAYPRGHLITVAGPLQGVRNERLQGIYYRYPVVSIEQIHLWTQRSRDYYYYDVSPGWYWGYYPQWWDGGTGWYYPGGYGGYTAPENHPN
ncbi:MAG TPA: Slp family lipoprotein [Candidatus Sulfotelmatobacter sp.]|nr:Slp family lipoprotein [Candidatus Sulfotelmatobacter sp.]